MAEDVEIDEEDDSEDEEDVPVVVADPEAAEASFDELVAKQVDAEEDDEEDSLLDLTREERLESLSIRAAPKQPNEFVCNNCHLVKHQSQLADKKRTLCRDCV